MKKAVSFVLAFLFLLCCTACAANPQEVSFFAMDTAVSLRVYGNAAKETASKLQAQVFSIDATLNRHSKTSAVAALNRGETVAANTAYIKDLLPLCLEICEATDGAFEPTLAAVSDAWQFTSDSPTVPSDKTLQTLLQSVGLREHPFAITETGITLGAQTQVDFGAIAKGYTLDCLDKAMRKSNCSGTLDLGGEVCVVGTKEDGSPWRVGIKNPVQSEQLLGILSLQDAFIATSGAYERFFEQDGVRYHHILNPKTGKPTDSGLISVTVVGQSGAWADALSTALFVLGEEGARDLQKSLAATHPFEYVLVTDDFRVIVSRGLSEKFTLQNTDYLLQIAE